MPFEARPRTEGDDRRVVLARPGQRGLHVGDRLGEDDGQRQLRVRIVFIAAMGLENCLVDAHLLSEGRV